MTFNPHDHLMQIKNRNGSNEYLPVAWRLVWFRELCPEGSIETEMLHLDLDRETEEEGYAWNNETRRSEKIIKRANGLAVFRAIVKDGKGGIATGTKSEKAASFPDFIEKAETGSIGRALAALGFGTQFTGDELDEGERIVDAPVDQKNKHNPLAEANRLAAMLPEDPQIAPSSGNIELDAMPPSNGQLENIRQLALHLGTKILKPKTFKEAAQMLNTMQSEWDQMKSRGRAS